MRRINNLAVWLLNIALLTAVAITPDEIRHPWPWWQALLCGFIALDLLSYVSHRLLHAIPYGWRLHALHHSDPTVDLTTAVRNHPGEAFLVTAVYWLVVLVAGVPALAIVVHGSTAFVAAAITHCRIVIPERIERVLRWVVITPDLHLVHHSIDRIEANGNFGDVLSIWDRLFGTLLILSHDRVAQLRFGIRGIHDADATRSLAMLLTPLRIGKMYLDTRYLRDGREIELSASMLGKTTRLRARLVENGIVTAAHMRDFRGAPWRTPANIAEFTREFEGIAHITAPHPLFLLAEKVAA